MNQMNNKQIMVVAQLEQFQRTHREAKKDGPLPKHIRGLLARYKDWLTNGSP